MSCIKSAEDVFVDQLHRATHSDVESTNAVALESTGCASSQLETLSLPYPTYSERRQKSRRSKRRSSYRKKEPMTEEFEVNDEDECISFTTTPCCSRPVSFAEVCASSNASTVQIFGPMLIFIQFSFLFYVNDVSIQRLSLSLVMVVLLLFTITSSIYRQSLNDLLSRSPKSGILYGMQTRCVLDSALLSMPDFVINIVLGLILCKRTDVAYASLLYGSSMMTIPITINAIRMFVAFLRSLCTHNEDELDITAEDALMGFTSPYFDNDNEYEDTSCSCSDENDFDTSMRSDFQDISEAIPFFSDL